MEHQAESEDVGAVSEGRGSWDAAVRGSPAGPRFSDLPPAYIEAEEFDCLHDEGIAYAKALEEAGVKAQVEDVRGTFHGFDFFIGSEISKAMADKRTRALQQVFIL